MLLLLMRVILSQETGFCNQDCCQKNLIKHTMDPQNMNKIITAYISPRHIEVECAKSVKNICMVGV